MTAAKALFVVALIWPSLAAAQNLSERSGTPVPWEVEPYVGAAAHSPAGTHLGATPGRNHLFVGVHITGRILAWKELAIAYAPELLPLLLVSDTPTYHTVTLAQMGSYRQPDGRKTVAGFGFSPVGFEGRVGIGPRVRAYIATATGVVMFTRATPVPDARRFNYTFEVGGGVDYQVRRGWWLRAGYKFHHFSNANSALDNPGVDAKVLMIGVARGIGRLR